ncbi:hypothetical protein [Micromonospora sp. Mcm103]|nr:hypothetical protein [Micromonospora sp. Mcm103]
MLRAVVPLIAGTGGMRWPVFLRANLAGGLVWATAVALRVWRIRRRAAQR